MRKVLFAILIAAASVPGHATCDVSAYLARNGEEIDTSQMRLEHVDGRITLAFEAGEDGIYQVGLAIVADMLTPLAPGLEQYAAEDLAEPVTLRYPYDWTYVGERNVLNLPRLAIPGVLAGGDAYVVDTREMTAAVLERGDDGRSRTLLLAHRYSNDGADAATPDLALKAGESIRMEVRVFDDLRAAARARGGSPRGIDGTMVQVAYRGWTAQTYGEAEYAKIAETLEGVYDWVLVREVDSHDWIPSILHERGLKALHYQYIGALRRHSDQVTDEMPQTIGMRGAGGEVYTAPCTPDANWLMGDIRRPEEREIFVENAVGAIEAGFDGIFLDGTIPWPDSTGRRGGNVPDAQHSLIWAQWKLLSEIVAAVHEAHPDAVVGCLGNDYYDALGEADFVLKERMYFLWDDFARQFTDRATKTRMTLDVGFETGEAPLYGAPLVYGVKGYSSIAVRSGMGFMREPTGRWYLGTGDHFPDTLDEWLATVVAHASDGLRITRIEPENAWLHFEGRDIIYAGEDCRIEVSQPVCLADVEGECLNHQETGFELGPDTRYRILHDCGGE